MNVLSDEKLQCLDMSFDSLLTWGDDGFEAECVSPSVCASVRFSDGELSHRPAQKIEPYLPLIGLEGVSHLGLARFQFQSHVL